MEIKYGGPDRRNPSRRLERATRESEKQEEDRVRRWVQLGTEAIEHGLSDYENNRARKKAA